MIDKQNISFTISESDILAILRVCGEEKDPNFQDVPRRDIPNYLRERYWIKQWSSLKRWKSRKFANCAGQTELRRADLGRKLDDPGDAFFDLFVPTSQSIVRLRTWLEVTEVFLESEQAKKVNKFIREYNSLRGKREINANKFLKSIDFGPPDSHLQHEMVDRVIAAIEKKAKKGRAGGSYQSLVHDYGRGQLIVGLPLWFATLPSDPTTPSIVLTDFAPRLLLGLDKIKSSFLCKNWCPFDSVVILWNPTLESIDEWAKIADPNFYSDPANLNWKTPISPLYGYSFLKKNDFPKPDNITCSVRWDKYATLDAMLADQRQWLRFPNNPRPLGPKACLEVSDLENRNSILHIRFYNWLLQLWLFVRINGWYGFHRWIASRFSVCRLYSRFLLRHQARKLYCSSTSNHSKSNDNDHAGELE